jgi:hypothetical protein
MAEQYWQVLTQDERISAEFRGIAAACFATLNALPRIGRMGTPGRALPGT